MCERLFTSSPPETKMKWKKHNFHSWIKTKLQEFQPAQAPPTRGLPGQSEQTQLTSPRKMWSEINKPIKGRSHLSPSILGSSATSHRAAEIFLDLSLGNLPKVLLADCCQSSLKKLVPARHQKTQLNETSCGRPTASAPLASVINHIATTALIN